MSNSAIKMQEKIKVEGEQENPGYDAKAAEKMRVDAICEKVLREYRSSPGYDEAANERMREWDRLDKASRPEYTKEIADEIERKLKEAMERVKGLPFSAIDWSAIPFIRQEFPGRKLKRQSGAQTTHESDDEHRLSLTETEYTYEWEPGAKIYQPAPEVELGPEAEVGAPDELVEALEDFKQRVCDHYSDPSAVVERNGKIKCRCPAHNDNTPTLHVKVGDDKIVLHCFAGCDFDQIVGAVGMKPWQFFRGLTLAEVAEEKKIPVEKLQSWGVTQAGKRVMIGYFRDGGEVACTRYRQRESVDRPKITTRTGDTLALYGEYSRGIPSAKQAKYACFVEGESDCWTLWHRGIPAYGVPGATCSSVILGRHLDGLERAYVWQEPGKGGQTFVDGVVGRLAKLGFGGEVFVIKHATYKDPSELHCSVADWGATWANIISTGATVAIARLPDADPESPEEPTGKHRFGQMGDEIVKSMTRAGHNPLYLGGTLHAYTGTHYVTVPDSPLHIRAFFRRWDWATSNAVIANAVSEVHSRAWPGAERDMPFFKTAGAVRAENVIAYQNGLLDIKSGELHPHTPDWCSPTVLPYPYSPDATCPLWLRFMQDVYEHDPDRVALLQEYAGYLLSSDTCHEKALVLSGKTRSGKSTIQRVLTELVGTTNATGFSLDKLASEFGPAMLVGKSLAVIGEVELSGSRDKAKILELWKRIIGRDIIDINIKHRPQISTRLNVRFLVACNDIPRLHDPSGALAARLLYLPHDVSFSGREDRGLGTNLLTELPGIANWALSGLRRLRARGNFTYGKASTRVSDAAAVETTPVRAWVKECVEIEHLADPGDLPGCVVTTGERIEATRSGLYNSYTCWCYDHDMTDDEIKSQVWFFRELSALIPKTSYTKITDEITGQRHNGLRGVRLKRS